MPVKIEIYFATYCGHCHRAMRLLDQKQVPYERIDVTHDPERRAWLRDVTGRRTVPQIFIDGRSIGGSDDLHALDASGQLDEMIGETKLSEGNH